MMRWILAILLVWIMINLLAPHFDEYCIIGQLSRSQAIALNQMEWEAGGKMDALPRDRVLNRECSEFSRRFFRVLR